MQFQSCLTLVESAIMHHTSQEVWVTTLLTVPLMTVLLMIMFTTVLSENQISSARLVMAIHKFLRKYSCPSPPLYVIFRANSHKRQLSQGSLNWNVTLQVWLLEPCLDQKLGRKFHSWHCAMINVGEAQPLTWLITDAMLWITVLVYHLFKSGSLSCFLCEWGSSCTWWIHGLLYTRVFGWRHTSMEKCLTFIGSDPHVSMQSSHWSTKLQISPPQKYDRTWLFWTMIHWRKFALIKSHSVLRSQPCCCCCIASTTCSGFELKA